MSGDVQPATAMSVLGRPRAPSLDLRPLETLLARIEEKYHAEQVWLFGSRARGDAEPSSDWDLFVVVPDETDEGELDPRVAWRLQRGSGVHADVIPCRATDFRNACDTVNTLSYIVACEGVLIYDR
jgi:predicted nucleotidyltransferase